MTFEQFDELLNNYIEVHQKFEALTKGGLDTTVLALPFFRSFDIFFANIFFDDCFDIIVSFLAIGKGYITLAQGGTLVCTTREELFEGLMLAKQKGLTVEKMNKINQDTLEQYKHEIANDE